MRPKFPYSLSLVKAFRLVAWCLISVIVCLTLLVNMTINSISLQGEEKGFQIAESLIHPSESKCYASFSCIYNNQASTYQSCFHNSWKYINTIFTNGSSFMKNENKENIADTKDENIASKQRHHTSYFGFPVHFCYC